MSNNREISPRNLWVWVGVIFSFMVIASGWWGLTRRQAVAPDPAAVPTVSQRYARVDIPIEGMDCIMCAAGLQSKLRAHRGVRKAEVSYQEKVATIEYDPALIDRTRLVEFVAADGFKVAGQGTSPSPGRPGTR